MTRHVVFGTGQVGGELITQLVHAGHGVTAVSRHGRQQFSGAHSVAGDASDAHFTREVCAGADVVYFCLNAPDYHRWPEQFPPLQRGVLAGAQSAGARLVVLDNLYGYGATGGRELTEDLPLNAKSAKGQTRAAMTRELLDANASGSVAVAIGRASDYFGPRAPNSVLGEFVFDAALRGKTAQVMGNADRLHSYSYTPDVAAGLITLGTDSRALGQVWHLPVADAWTTREIIERIFQLAGHKTRLYSAGRVALGAYGLIKPPMREYLRTLYQFTDDWKVSDAKFRDAFGDRSTPLADAIATTLDWYRHRADAN